MEVDGHSLVWNLYKAVATPYVFVVVPNKRNTLALTGVVSGSGNYLNRDHACIDSVGEVRPPARTPNLNPGLDRTGFGPRFGEV